MKSLCPRPLFPLLVLLAGAGLVAGCNHGGGRSANSIGIGQYGSLSGDNAMFGQTTDQGVRLAVDEVNGGGGVIQKQLALEALDDVSKADQVQAIIQRLINNGDSVIVGEVASKCSIAAAPLCDQHGIPMISPSSTNTKVTVDERTGVRPFVFRVCFIDPFQGAVIARFVHDNLKKTTAAVLYNSAQDYDLGLKDGFETRFKSMGGTITDDEAFATGDKDFRSQLTSIKGTNPDVLMVPAYYNEVNLIVKQARGLGIDCPIIGGDGWDSSTLTDGAEAEFKDCYFSDHFSPQEDRPEVKQFVAAFQKKYGEEPNALAALGYDAVKLAADAIKRAGKDDPKAIRDAIEQTKDFPGVTGKITIDKDHNAVKPAVIVRVDGKKRPLVTIIKPD